MYDRDREDAQNKNEKAVIDQWSVLQFDFIMPSYKKE